jgi:hypothetical protein
MIKMKKYFLIFLLLIPINAISQKKDNDNLVDNSIVKIHKDTIFVVSQEPYKKIAENYQEILEKTNNQLSLWWNPYSVFVTSLGVLFAIFAVITAIVVFRQSKEHKDLIKKSLEDHKIALDKLIIEKNEQFNNYEANLEKSIKEYKEQLATVSKKDKIQIEQFISKLEAQKAIIDIPLHKYIHSGWDPLDVPLNYPINQFSNFYARIILNKPNQEFIIYIRLINSENKRFWLGFGGKDITLPAFAKIEFTQYKFYNSSVVTIDENIHSCFKSGFPTVTSLPVLVDCVRLRGSINDDSEISFNFKIS